MGFLSEIYKNCGKAVEQEQNPDDIEQEEFTSNDKREKVYEGKIYKCPNCGEVLKAFVSTCPSCGYEIRGAENSYAIQDFVVKLANTKSTQEKISLIQNFPIPNTKEDIWEFMILAFSKLDENPENKMSVAWQSKIEQAYEKAKLVFHDEKEFARIQTMYNQANEKVNKGRRKRTFRKTGNILSTLMLVLPNVIVVAGWLISVFALLPFCGVNLDNVGTNSYQTILILVFIAGAIVVPWILRCKSVLPSLIFAFGWILSIVLLIPLCGKDLDNVGTNAYQTLLFFDIVCGGIILVRTFKYERKVARNKSDVNMVSLVIALICVAIFLLVFGIGKVSSYFINEKGEQEYLETQSVVYEWPTSGLAQILPEPPTLYGEIETDDDERFNIEIYQVSNSQFKDYTEECEENGFNINVTETDTVFYAYNDERYDLNIFYYEEENKMEIFLDAPIEMVEIEWPDNKLTNQVPQPESMVGNIQQDSSDRFAVYIADVSEEQYSEYVDSCMEKGFTVDYTRGDTFFHAYNKKGYYLEVKKMVFDEIYISISAPEENDE